MNGTGTAAMLAHEEKAVEQPSRFEVAGYSCEACQRRVGFWDQWNSSYQFGS